MENLTKEQMQQFVQSHEAIKNSAWLQPGPTGNTFTPPSKV